MGLAGRVRAAGFLWVAAALDGVDEFSHITHRLDGTFIEYKNPETGKTVRVPEQKLAAVSVSAGQWHTGQWSAAYRMQSRGDFSAVTIAATLLELREAVDHAARSRPQVERETEEQRETYRKSVERLKESVVVLTEVVRQLRTIATTASP